MTGQNLSNVPLSWIIHLSVYLMLSSLNLFISDDRAKIFFCQVVCLRYIIVVAK